MRGTVNVTTTIGWRVVEHKSKAGGFVGYIDATYDRLIELLGKPKGSNPFGKVKAEWVVRFTTGDEFYIYDFKSNKEPEDRTYWHVGGSRKAAEWFFNSLGITMYRDR